MENDDSYHFLVRVPWPGMQVNSDFLSAGTTVLVSTFQNINIFYLPAYKDHPVYSDHTFCSPMVV